MPPARAEPPPTKKPTNSATAARVSGEPRRRRCGRASAWAKARGEGRAAGQAGVGQGDAGADVECVPVGARGAGAATSTLRRSDGLAEAALPGKLLSDEDAWTSCRSGWNGMTRWKAGGCWTGSPAAGRRDC